MLSPERRTSMAERRPSFANFSGNSNHIDTLMVPHLAGIEDPLPETTPEKVDVLIAGTGLVESVLAAALAWQGSNVLHVDSNDYYGDSAATLTVDQIKNWVNRIHNSKNESEPYKNAKLYISSSNIGPDCKYASRDFGIDLSPKILFAKSDLLSILVKSRVHQYLEFQSLSTFHTYENDSFEKLTNTKQDIFTDQNLTLMTKRNLMKFLKFVLNWEKMPEIWQPYADKSITDFLFNKFKLEKPQVFELVFSIGLCSNMDTKVPLALNRIRRYLVSYDVYGPFPVLYSKYGGAGEVSQGFCRSAAVAGATYKLNEKLYSYNPTTQVATFTDGSKVTVTEKIIMSPTQAPEGNKHVPEQKYEVNRMVCLVEKDCKEWFSEDESAAVVVFPPGSLKSGNKHVVQTLIMGSGSECCPQGTSIWYLSTTESGVRAEMDLDAALEALEISIIRESSEEITNDNDIVQISDDGRPIINSVRLGQSFKEYVPRESVQHLMKLSYTQLTSTPPFDVVNPALFDNDELNNRANSVNKFIPNASDNGIIYTAMPSSEISYDEVVTAAKVLYEKIVGSDDDFFDVDFEDDDNDAMPTGASVNGVINYENAIEDDEEDIQMGEDDSNEFVGEMEI
ncbi:Rab proteins geranylgeranyltransferase component A [Maudiozyma exigua]|uniref:Rab proteins geranylgeranyltransferase component A n=1 Tax=Maudiozyma exigua TaxID=34358 RepID=A0A9P6WF68_MAUEX|nr:Rab proteins geranylgeranyltransferase component A [Kazachstania exigua]